MSTSLWGLFSFERKKKKKEKALCAVFQKLHIWKVSDVSGYTISPKKIRSKELHCFLFISVLWVTHSKGIWNQPWLCHGRAPSSLPPTFLQLWAKVLILPLHAVVVAPQDRNIPSIFHKLWLMGRFPVPGETKESLLHKFYVHLYVQV